MAAKHVSRSPEGSAASRGSDLAALLSVRQAIEVIDSTPVHPRIERLPLAAARGYRLARDLIADRDYPPFAKSVMDGFAVRSADLKELAAAPVDGRRDRRDAREAAPAVELKVVGEVPAGQLPGRAVGPGEAIAIMTGAPMPEGADAVVPVEEAEGAEKTWGEGAEKTLGVGSEGVGGGEERRWGVGSERVGSRGKEKPWGVGSQNPLRPHPLPPHSPLPTSFLPDPHSLHPTASNAPTVPNANILRIGIKRHIAPGFAVAKQGSDCTAGAVVLKSGAELQAAQIAAAATIGAAEVDVFARPRVGVLSTGDELVGVGESPGPAQIRNSNNLMLIALLQRMGCEVTNLGTVPDEPKVIRRALEQGMRLDALFVTGGMSMGAYDYVPRILREMGVELKITKVRIKPGKPFVFGVRGVVEEKTLGVGSDGVGGTEEKTLGVGSEGVGGTEGKTLGVGSRKMWGVGSDGVGGGGEKTLGVGSEGVGRENVAAAHPPHPHSLLPTSSGSPLPTSFGVRPASYVFGLPGNPVSAFVCTVRLASRLLARLAGGEPGERWVTGRLEAGLPANGPREFYQPVVRHVPAGGTSAKSELAQIRPLHWKGSADLFTLAAANALLIRGENEPPVPQGTMVRVLEI